MIFAKIHPARSYYMQNLPGRNLYRFFAPTVIIFLYGKATAQENVLPLSFRPSVTIAPLNADTLSFLRDLQNIDSLAKWQPDTALKKYKEALQLGYALNFPGGQIAAMYRIGSLYMKRSVFDSAFAYLKSALYIAMHTRGANKMLPMIQVQLAETHQCKGDYEMAVQSFYHALAANKKLPQSVQTDKAAAEINIALGAIFSILKQYHKANVYLASAERIAQKHDDRKLYANVLLQKAAIAFDQADSLDKSISYFEEALGIARKHKFQQIEFIAINNLGIAYCQQKNMPEALKQVAKMSLLLKDDRYINAYQKTSAVISIAEIYLAAKRYNEAEQFLLQALSLADLQGSGQNQMDAHDLLYQLYKQKGHYAKALHHQEEQIRLMDQIKGKEVDQYVNELEVKYRTVEKDKDIAHKQLLIERQGYKIGQHKTYNIIGIGTALIMLVCLGLLIRLYRNRTLLRDKKVEILEQAQKIAQLKGIMQGEQGERLRIAAELHDGIGGILATLKMKFLNTRKQYPEWAGNQAISEIDYLIEHTANEIRRTSHNLMPDALTRYALKDALILYRDEVCSVMTEPVIDILFIGEDMDDINNTMNLVIYRMVQEMIQNILKHAAARQAVIQIVYRAKRIKIIAEDDGKGFDPSAGYAGIGLKTLQSRVHALGSTITVNSAPGKGTAIFIELDSHVIT